MSDFSTTALEFEAVRRLVDRHVQTPEGHRLAEHLAPSVDRDWIRNEIENVHETRRFLEELGQYGLADLADPGPLLQKLRIAGTFLEGAEVHQLGAYLAAGSALAALLGVRSTDYPRLSRLADEIPNTRDLQKEIRTKILPGGELDDRASKMLADVRHELTRVRARLQRILESMITGPAAAQVIQDAYITIRNGRFVIPARSDSPFPLPGVVHGSSSSGATLFVEPLATVELNNDLTRLLDQEQEEIRRILLELSEHLREREPELRATVDCITEVDWRMARAQFGRAYECTAPTLTDTLRVDLRHARHPLLVDRLADRVVPIDIELGGSGSALIISGPNTGGKTVALKTLGLAVVMAQSGLPVAARQASLPVFDQVLVDIGDHQSISENLSTFSSHILNLASIVERLAPPALVLIDEIGTGTDPEQGAALAVALLEHFTRQGALVAVTTHYHKVKEYGYNHAGVINASVEFDDETLRPTFRLLLGTAGSSSGLEIAERLGLPARLVSRARELIDERTLQGDQFLSELRMQLQQAAEKNRAADSQAEQLRRQQEQMRRDALAQQMQQEDEAIRRLTRRLRELEESFLKEARGSLRKAEDRLLAAQLRREQERKTQFLKEKFLHEIQTGKPHQTESPELKAGDRVTIVSLRQQGKILELSAERAVVEVSGKRLSVPAADVEPTGPAEKKPAFLPENVRLHRTGEETSAELNVVGCTVEEALERADKFLDQAVLSRHDSVRIIHGFGTGKLRRALADFLKGHPHVGSHRIADADHGGGGVTIVELAT
ncbi:MAG: endonuclease MutS2 [Acidobacteriota bacterium]